MACSLDRRCQRSLMSSACAGDAAGKDLPAFGDVLAQLCCVLIIDRAVLSAEDTNLLLSVEIKIIGISSPLLPVASSLILSSFSNKNLSIAS